MGAVVLLAVLVMLIVGCRCHGNSLDATHARHYTQQRADMIALPWLPPGTALPFGSMIRQLKRNQMLKDVTQVREQPLDLEAPAFCSSDSLCLARQQMTDSVLQLDKEGLTV